MPLNAVRFGAKRSAFWCKTQGQMVQNAVQNAAKRKAKSINIHRKCIRQNGAKCWCFLKIEHIIRRERLETGAIYLHYGLYFR